LYINKSQALLHNVLITGRMLNYSNSLRFADKSDFGELRSVKLRSIDNFRYKWEF